MSTSTDPRKKPRRIGRIILLSLIAILLVAGIFLYNNFNKLVSDALMTAFNTNVISDVYELKFEKLRVNIFGGTVSVANVVVQPREVPAKKYPYINSSFRLTTKKILLLNVDLLEFLKTKKINVERVVISNPEIQATVAGERAVLFPFNDSTKVDVAPTEGTKKTIESFSLVEFQLVDASIKSSNSFRHQRFSIEKFSISLRDLLIKQRPGKDFVSFSHVEASIGTFASRLVKKGGVRSVGLKDFKIGIDSLEIQNTVDTLTFKVDDFTSGLKALNIQTADSLFHVTMRSFDFSYKEKSIVLDSLSFTPNISDAEMQSRFEFQHTQISGGVQNITLRNVNFDSLIYHRSLFIDEIVVNSPAISIFKDNTKPVDKNRFPKYFGQQIGAIPIPLRVKQVTVANINLVNVERKRDSSYAKVSIRRGKALVKNITNLSKNSFMTMAADAYVEDKVHFNVQLDFSYREPLFNFTAKLEKFNLPDLNPVLLAYTPAKINAGIADEISFSGTVDWTGSSGTMKFLYHELDVDLALKDQARWKSSVLAFAANSIVNSSNPGHSNLPPRVVHLQAKRDMNKGFVNIIIKSVLSGVKETMIASKENRKAYKVAKRQAKDEKKDD